jgi:CcmD family protein
MVSDAATFFLSFLAVFAGLAAYLWHLDRTARRLEARLATLEAATAKAKPGEPPAPPQA